MRPILYPVAKGAFGLSNIQVGGRVGDLVFLPQAGGRVVVRRMPAGLPPRTALQDEAAERMGAVGAAWRGLSFEEAAAWEAYVRAAQGWAAPAGKAPTQAYGAFLGLGAKRLQVLPHSPVPSLPPATPFLGDGISVGCGAAPGAVGFVASAPNSPGVVTELLLQPLAGKHRKPTAKGYRTRVFVAFAPGALAATVAVAPGAWACAVRFVREATGHETAVVPLGKILVEG